MTVDTVHVHVDNLSRARPDGTERSAVAHAAYISGSALYSERDQRLVTYSGRRDVVVSTLVLPEGAPAWAGERQVLWNRVEASARRRDARLAKTIDAAIPREIARAFWPELLQSYVGIFTRLGMAAEAAIHEDGTGHNPHVHVMLTVSAFTPEGFGAKLVNADQKAFVTLARRGWESVCNASLKASGSALRVDARSYKARGIDKTPTKHRGPNSQERRGRRAFARQLRQERLMANPPTQDERRLFPLLTQRDEWPPQDRADAPFSPAERQEFERYVVARREASQEAAAAQMREHRTTEWFAGRFADGPAPEKAEERPWYLRPQDDDVGRVAAPPDKDPQWYLRPQAERQEPIVSVEAAWDQPGRDDFRDLDRLAELQKERTAYEDDLWRRAVMMNRTRQENDLMKRAAAVSPETRKSVEAELLRRRIEKLRDQDDAKRLQEFEDRLGPALSEPYEDYVRSEADNLDRDPVPGPYGRPEHPDELRQAQEEMLREYERDPDEPGR